MNKNLIKLTIVVAVIGIVAAMLRYYGATELIRDVPKIKGKVDSFGGIAPLVYIALYIVATVFLIPGLPVTLLAGVAFGPFLGVVYVAIASFIGVSLAFLIARYAARDMVEHWVAGNEQLQKIDAGVERHGWRMVMITRLVPLFPFNLQNYAYGLTRIRFFTYFFVSWLCMLPATVAYVQVGGALISGKGDPKKTAFYLAIAGILIVLVLLVPGFIRKYRSV